jgi:CheY-like chemotaxis protein
VTGTVAGSRTEARGAGAAGQAGSRVVIEVTDSGTGIASDDLQRIFKPFEQARADRRPKGEGGLGLGLSIARAITELHDGEISVHSDGVGTGATFTVVLPLCIDRQPALFSVDGRSPSHAVPAPATSLTFRILLVEDHRDTAMAIGRMLRRAGFEVEHVSTVALATERWQAQLFHILISDLGLPDGTGFDALNKISAVSKHRVRAICMSGYGMETDLVRSREAGFHVHLIKPVSKSRLLGAIHELVGGS